jgi:hypothetical protein
MVLNANESWLANKRAYYLQLELRGHFFVRVFAILGRSLLGSYVSDHRKFFSDQTLGFD